MKKITVMSCNKELMGISITKTIKPRYDYKVNVQVTNLVLVRVTLPFPVKIIFL